MPQVVRGEICSVKEVARGVFAIEATAQPPVPVDPPTTLLDVIEDWGCLWLWKTLRLYGDDNWLLDSIREGTCVAVTDGSYIKELFPTVCSTAFVLECSQGRGKIVGSLVEQLAVACAYRGELLGLMAIHLIFLSASKLDRC